MYFGLVVEGRVFRAMFVIAPTLVLTSLADA
jgi:hypothetical protein